MTTPPFIPPASQLRAITDTFCRRTCGGVRSIEDLSLAMTRAAALGFSNVVPAYNLGDAEIVALQEAGYRVHVVEGRALRVDW